ncbi:OLC1v1037130C1 [Oldenlandia corymbosa var. corymbosa]|nr:OLC1v1037130C1 [Oldenlandia corymbosa var. corymbosa]
MARLNPRDCWYWLSGSCLNPTCAFRHPPLDTHAETGPESAAAKQQSALPVNKSNVPCYYFYNGYCNKGESCYFMHGPEGSAPLKSSKQTSTAVDVPPVEKKMPKGSDLRPAVAVTTSCGTKSKISAETEVTPKQKLPQPEQKLQQPEPKLQQPVSDNFAKQSACQQISKSPSEEAATTRSNSPSQTEGRVQRHEESPYKSSDNELDDDITHEDWRESSPGFDVLVNNGAEDIVYEDEYSLHHDLEERENSDQHLGYNYQSMLEYDPTCPDLRVTLDRGLPDYYSRLDKDTSNGSWVTPMAAGERLFDRPMRSKRSTSDLRDFLKRRRMSDNQHSNIFFDRPYSPRLMDQISEKSSFGDRRLCGRLASKVEISAEARLNREPLRSNTHQHHREPLGSGTYRHRREMHADSRRFKRQTRERRQGKRHTVSEISGKTASRRRMSNEDPTMFTGPKTLAQLKEEKNKSLGSKDVDGTGPSYGKP